MLQSVCFRLYVSFPVAVTLTCMFANELGLCFMSIVLMLVTVRLVWFRMLRYAAMSLLPVRW